MYYQHKGVDEAARLIIHKKLKEAGGSGGQGGLVALDNKGNITMPFNTKGKYRGYVTDKTIFTAIYEEE